TRRRPKPAARSLSYLALLRVGFTEPIRSPGPLVSSYLTVSPLPLASERRSAFCGTDPWGRPPWPLASTLPCGARTFLPRESPRAGDRPAFSGAIKERG